MSNKKVKEETAVAPRAAAPASHEAKRLPVKSFREDDVSASVWAREHVYKGQPTVFHSVSFERSYKDAAGKYRYTKNFDATDIGKLVTVAQRAAEYIFGLEYPEAEALPANA